MNDGKKSMRMIDVDALKEKTIGHGEIVSFLWDVYSSSTIDAIPVDFLMQYAQVPTEFAIEAWNKRKKESLKRQVKENDKPMSFDEALELVDKEFPIGN